MLSQNIKISKYQNRANWYKSTKFFPYELDYVYRSHSPRLERFQHFGSRGFGAKCNFNAYIIHFVIVFVLKDSSMKQTGEEGLYESLPEAERRRILAREVADFAYTGPSKVGCKCKTFF
jgi:hypothetical protein